MRRGPRPLLLHLTLAMLRSNVSRATSPLWNADWPTSSVAAILQSIQNAVLDGSHENEFSAAVVAETLRQDAALIAGIAAYRRHPWRRTLADPPAVWSEGGTRLLDYGPASRPAGAVRPQPDQPGLCAGPRRGPFDAALARRPGRSAAAARLGLAGGGRAPVHPDRLRRRPAGTGDGRGRTDRRRPARAGRLLHGRHPGGRGGPAPPGPDQRPGAAGRALGFPRAGRRARAAGGARPCRCWSRRWRSATRLPVDLLQSLFALLDPWGVADKYRGFARLPPDSERARLFVALEDWLNDGVPLAAEVARDPAWASGTAKTPRPAATGALPGCRSIPPRSPRRPSSPSPAATASCPRNPLARWLG